MLNSRLYDPWYHSNKLVYTLGNHPTRSTSHVVLHLFFISGQSAGDSRDSVCKLKTANSVAGGTISPTNLRTWYERFTAKTHLGAYTHMSVVFLAKIPRRMIWEGHWICSCIKFKGFHGLILCHLAKFLAWWFNDFLHNSRRLLHEGWNSRKYIRALRL